MQPPVHNSSAGRRGTAQGASETVPDSSSSTLYGRAFICAFLSQVGFVLSNTMMTHYARWIVFLGGDDSDVGWVMGGGAVFGLLARPWIGQWIDRSGARQMWLSGYLIFAIGTLLNLWISEPGALLYLSRAINVLGSAFVFSSSLAYITQLAPIARRTEAIGVLGCAGFLGIIIGPFCGQLLLHGDRTRDDFAGLFLIAAAALVIPVFLLLLLPESGVPRPRQRVQLMEFVRCSCRNWPGAIGLVQCVFGLCMAVPFIFMTRFVDEIGSVHPGAFRETAVSWFFVCYAGWGLIVRLASRRLPDQLGRRKVLLAGSLAMACGMAIFSLEDAGDPWPALVLSALVCGTGHALMFHTGTALFLEPFPEEKRGVGAALSLMVMDTGMIAGAPLLGIIAEEAGYRYVFLTVSGACCLSLAVYAVSSVPVWKSRSRMQLNHRR